MDHYIAASLELHLFFARIMKEHAFFLNAGFFAKDRGWSNQARWFQAEFERLLEDVIRMGDGVISEEVTASGELVTPFTLQAEEKTMQYTGKPLDMRITRMEKRLQSGECVSASLEMRRRIHRINQLALRLVKGLILFKENLLSEIKSCRIFNANYPLLIEHILREAKLYCSFLCELEEHEKLCMQDMRETEIFWNQIMMEHALFIRGLLDPTEGKLIEASDEFAAEYELLLEEAKRQNSKTMDDLTKRTIQETIKYRDFKAAGAKGILECEILSLILPLLADHVLREANHYLRLLG